VVLFRAEVEQVSESDTAKQLKYWVDVEGSENHRVQPAFEPRDGEQSDACVRVCL